MADEKKKPLKSYMLSLQMEIVSDDDEHVKAVRIHGFQNEPLPLALYGDVLQCLTRMTPGKEVMFIQNGKRVTE